MATLELPDELFDLLSQLAHKQHTTLPHVISNLITRNAMFENSFDAVLVTDNKMNYVDANPAACELLGYSLDEIRQLTVEDLAIELDTLEADIEQFFAVNKQQGEYQLRHKAGKVITVEFTALSGVMPDRHIAICRDITLQKDTEKKLLDSEQRFQAFMDNAPMVAYIKDKDLNHIYGNHYMSEVIQKFGGEYQNATPLDLFPADVVKSIQAADQEVLISNKTVVLEDYAIEVGGYKTWYKEAKFPIDSAEGERYIGGFAIDITEQYKMQEALAHSEIRYRSLFESSLHSITLFDGDATIQMINSAGAEFLNDTIDNIIGRPLRDFVPDLHDTIVKRIQDVMKSGEALYIEDTITLPGDNTRTFWSVLQPVSDTDHNRLGVQILSYDVTEQRQAAELKMKQDQLELALTKERQLSELRTRLLTTISHEFRTPLAIIETNSEMLIRYHDRFTREQQAEKLNHIIQQIRHLAGMLDNIRALSLSQHNMLQFSPETVNLAGFLEQLETDFSHICQTTQTLHIQNNVVQEIVIFDPNLMRQALINLLKNAIKYTNEDAHIHIQLFQPQNTLTIRVQDNGIGIPSTDLAHIFHPFYRGKNVENIRGTGLGLAIVKEIIDLHRGSVTCESHVHQGSTFTIQMPIHHR